MSFKKFAAFGSQTLNDLLPLFCLTVCFGVWLVANLSAKTRVFEGLFHSVFSDLEGEHSMSQVFVTGLVMDRPQLFLESLELTHDSLQLVHLNSLQWSHSPSSSS